MKKLLIGAFVVSLTLAACGPVTPEDKPEKATDAAVAPVEAVQDDHVEVFYEDITSAAYKQEAKFKDYEGLRLVLFANNAEELTDLSCAQGYFSGDFSLALLNKENSILVYKYLGKMMVAPDAVHTTFEKFGETPDVFRYVGLQKYGSCNGDLFGLYEIAADSFVPFKFNDRDGNEVLAKQWEDIFVGDLRVKYSYYDNSQGETVKLEYKLNDEGVYDLVL